MENVQCVIEPEELCERLNSKQNAENYIIVDLSQVQLYDRAHVPGAVHLPFGRLTSGTKPAPGQLPPLEQLVQLLQEIGYAPDKEIIVYDDEGGGWAGRFIWTLDLIGHQKSLYLNGGIHNWLRKKLPVEKGAETASAPSFSGEGAADDVAVTIEVQNASLNVTKEYLLSRLGDPDTVIWDARSPEEYQGTRCFAQRAGHIPGAVNYEWTLAIDRANGFQMRPLDVVRQELAAIGITEDKEVITHCQTHHRSGYTYLLGKSLGFTNIKAYAGSWSEWGNDPDLPVEVDH